MNTFKILTFLLPLITSLSANAHTYRCEEISRGTNPKGRVFVTVDELEEVTKKVPQGKDFDHVYRVKVDIIQVAGKAVRLSRSFFSYATSLDVEYKINDTKEDVRFHLYLDEDDEAGIMFTDREGQKRKINLRCR